VQTYFLLQVKFSNY